MKFNFLLGEHLQLALNAHDGPMFLEQANHIPEEFHKYFGIEPLISSPRSESNTLVTNPDEDDNSNSIISVTSDKDTHTGSNVGLGAQMVLEQNLGALDEDMDEEEHDQEGKSKQRHPSSLQDSNSKLEDSMDDSSNMSPRHHKFEVDKTEGKEIKSSEVDSNKGQAEGQDEANYQRTRLPSFSSIIAGSPKTSLADVASIPGDQDHQDGLCLDAPPISTASEVVSASSSTPPVAVGGDKRRSSLDHELPHHTHLLNVNIDSNRRLSLDHQAASLIAANVQAENLARRASIDNGLMSLNFAAKAEKASGNNQTAPPPVAESTRNPQAASSDLLEEDNMLMSLPMTSSTTSMSMMSLETSDTKVTFCGTSQPQEQQDHSTTSTKIIHNLLKADQIPTGVQSLPPSGINILYILFLSSTFSHIFSLFIFRGIIIYFFPALFPIFFHCLFRKKIFIFVPLNFPYFYCLFCIIIYF